MPAHHIAVALAGGRYPHVPTCSCGWMAWGYLSWQAAWNVATDHLARESESA